MQARTLDAASGHWPEILQVIGGVSPEQLTDTHQPCPSCGGTDRFRWDNDEGPGGWYCSQCGGKNHQGGAGSGLDLLMRVKGWDLKQALRQVDQHLGNPTAPHLTVVPGPAPSKKPSRPYRSPAVPPASAPAPSLGDATAQWCYRDSTGQQLFWIQRINKQNGDKLFVHRVWLDGTWHFPSRRDDFTCQWPSPRPMYGLPQLQARPADPVLVAEGEKAADAAASLLPSHVAVSWSGGCKRANETDWSPLAGRTVVLWPDHDAAGRKAMADLAARLLKLGCNVTVVHLPDDFEDGWDLADADFGPERAAELLTLHSKSVEVPPPQAPPAGGGASRTGTVAPDEVLQLLPNRLGKLRINLRNGDVQSSRFGVLSNNEIGRLYLQLSQPGEKWTKEPTADGVALLARQNAYDPVAEYLDGITAAPLPLEQWEHLDRHLLGITDPIAARFLPRFLISAVARTKEPGCDVRQSPVLVGPQWRGKTALGRILFGAEHWVEGVGRLDRDALQRAHTAWGVELAELDGVTRRADPEVFKAFLTETVDSYRKPYDRAPERHPRRFVFWATSNAPPLRDSTGSTRFVVISLPDRMLPLDWATQHRDALWARALEQYRAGVEWDRCSEQERQDIAERNEDFREIDPWADRVAAFLKARKDELPVTVPELLNHLQVPTERQNNALAQRVRAIAAALGWKQDRRSKWIDGKPRKLKGLWPGHTGHTEDTPGCVRLKASDANGSQLSDTPDTPIQEKRLEEGMQEGGGTASDTGRGGSSASGVSGVSVAETPSSDAGSQQFAGVSEVCPPGVSEVCPPPWLPHLLAIRASNPTAHPSTLVNLLSGQHGITTTVPRVRALLEQHDRQAAA